MAKSKRQLRPRLTEKDSPVTVRSVMGRTFKNLSIESKIKEYKIIKNWEAAVGSIIAARTEPGRLKDSVLYVKVSSPSWVTELLYQKEEIISRLNRELGEKRIEDIIFKQGNISKEEVEEILEKVPERDLTKEEIKLIEEETSSIKDDALREKISKARARSMKVKN